MAPPADAKLTDRRAPPRRLALPAVGIMLLGSCAVATACAPRGAPTVQNSPFPHTAGQQDTQPTADPAASASIPKLAPFVVSPPEVVSRLLALADVSATDVVYDLGCGDGRIVIAAASRYGARGVGVDIDAALVAQASAAAAAAGVSHLVRFEVKNALDVDLSEATVVALYLLPSGNALLRPKLQRELRRGARVVAHSFDMGASWRPTKSETFYDDAGLPRIIHLWRISGRR